jgi:4-alpha-glucanotransferase
MLRRRSSGILMHITSLPSKHGIGDFGPEAYRFADFLRAAGQNYWQLLPLNDTSAKTGYSPYNCLSAFAGNSLLISPELLYRDGLLTKREVADPPAFRAERVDYEKVSSYKESLLEAAFARFRQRPRPPDYAGFVAEHRAWLDSYACFVALRKRRKGQLWSNWPAALRDCGSRIAECGLQDASEANPQAVERERFCQYIFYQQYLRLKRYCNDCGIQVVGDVPIYVADDSADVWSHPDLFKLNRAKKPRFVAGVPPDYFSATGQLWGNPVYDWQRLEETGFAWWMQRMKHNLLLFDFVRIDHFRGLVAYWEIPATHRNAMRGRWVQVPHEAFFRELLRQIPFAAIFVEDLGYITADVREVVAQYHFPRMSVLQFAFGGDPARNPYLPHNCAENSIVYTGTHDNNTTRGWFEKDLTRDERRRLFDYLGCRFAADEIAWELMRVALRSVAKIAILPMQDVLNLGARARMNQPAGKDGNWQWRMRPGRLDARLAERLRKLTWTYGRA